MLEMVLFNLLAFSLLIIIFFKIIRKNDANYVIILILEAVGILVSFIEIKLGNIGSLFWATVRYMFSVLIPLFVILLELKGINFSEIISVTQSKFFILIGNNKKAKSILVKLVSKYQESYIGHKLLAESYEKEGGMRRAIEEYVTAVDIRKKDYKSYFKITELLRDLGKKDEAIQMLDNLIKTKPDCYEGSILLGELLCEKELFKEAANVYLDALKYKPNEYDLYYNLGIIYTRLSDFQMAKEMYEKAAQINHLSYGLNYNLGLIAFIQKDYDVAEEYLQNSLYDDLEAVSYYQLAKTYIYKGYGYKDKAINFLNKSIELDPKLLKKAEKEKCFEKIREHITVSVNMNEKNNIYETEKKENKSNILLGQEEKAREYMEYTSVLIENMNESYNKQKLNEKLDSLFNKKVKNNKEENNYILNLNNDIESKEKDIN